VVRFAAVLTGDRALAEDLAQEVHRPRASVVVRLSPSRSFWDQPSSTLTGATQPGSGQACVTGRRADLRQPQ
jgi:hypothetical protein